MKKTAQSKAIKCAKIIAAIAHLVCGAAIFTEAMINGPLFASVTITFAIMMLHLLVAVGFIQNRIRIYHRACAIASFAFGTIVLAFLIETIAYAFSISEIFEYYGFHCFYAIATIIFAIASGVIIVKSEKFAKFYKAQPQNILALITSTVAILNSGLVWYEGDLGFFETIYGSSIRRWYPYKEKAVVATLALGFIIWLAATLIKKQQAKKILAIAGIIVAFASIIITILINPSSIDNYYTKNIHPTIFRIVHVALQATIIILATMALPKKAKK